MHDSDHNSGTTTIAAHQADRLCRLIEQARRPDVTDADLATLLRSAAADDGTLLHARSALTVLGEAVETHEMALNAAQQVGYQTGFAEGRAADGVSERPALFAVASLPA